MNFRDRLFWMIGASLLTTLVLNFVVDFTSGVVLHAESAYGYFLGYLLMMLSGILGNVISNLPSLAILWWKKFPDAVLVSLAASAEGFLLSSMIIPLVVWGVHGFGLWGGAAFISILAGYVIADVIVNRLGSSRKSRFVLLGMALAFTALMLALFLKA